jgi:hypothetical protein
MTGNQSGKIELRNIVLIGAAATAVVIINMLTGTEPPSQTVTVLQWIALAAALVTLVGGLIMMRRDRK